MKRRWSAVTGVKCTKIVLLGASALSATLGVAALAQQPDFGPNVYVLDPSMPASQVLSTLTSLSNEPQFGTNRYAVLFKPGTYAVQAPIGYYESIAGLGEQPGDVIINGYITPNFGTTTQYFPGTNVTDTFWRSMENMTFNVVTDSDQNGPPQTLQWGASQGAPLRRLQINGGLELTDSYCGFASGGFIADTVVTGNVNPCSQQQYFTRNSTLGSWTGGVWNMVFSGVEGAPAPSFPSPPETVVASTPVTREKPFLYVDSKGHYNVFAPAARHNSSGTSWTTGSEAGRSIPIRNFFIAKPSTPIEDIDLAMLSGKNLILTPGVYQYDYPIFVLYPDTIVLGLGYATLVPQSGNPAIIVEDVGGVQIAGLIVDAGPVNSPVLLKMGDALLHSLPPGGLFSHTGDPSSINDLTLRVGGATAGSATTSLEVDSADVILDDIWAWRADHGNGVGWTLNTGDHGLVVNGDRVEALGLAVEHYQKEQVLWKGNGGGTIFYQSELPYDPPSQAAWMDGSANGYPSYAVADSVTSHQVYGSGIYSFFDLGLNIIDDNAMTVPDVPGISLHDLGTVWLNGSGQITHVVNGQGAAVNSGYADQVSPIVTYP